MAWKDMSFGDFQQARYSSECQIPKYKILADL